MHHVPFFPADNAHIIFSRFYLHLVISELSRAIQAVINHPSHPYPRQQNLTDVLLCLARWTTRPPHLISMAYKWCSVICKRYQELDMGKEVLFRLLEIRFRHLDPQKQWMGSWLTHTEHHRSMADIVFGGRQAGVIANLLQAWVSQSHYHRPPSWFNICAKYLVDIRNLDSSPRLRLLVIRSIKLIGHGGFGEVAVEKLVGLLNHLGIGIDDIGSRSSWKDLLLEIIKSRKGRDALLYLYWELLVELVLPRTGGH